ncbi:hypothetical protein BsWGS_06374 [Bradybaena similaris]
MCHLHILQRYLHHASKIRFGHVFNTNFKLPVMSKTKSLQLGDTCMPLHGYGTDAETANTTDEEQILHYLNTLSAHEMRQEKHISPKLSELLCQYREVNGPFKTLSDVQKVRRFGSKSFKSLCEKLTANSNDTKKVNVAAKDFFFKFITPKLTPFIIQSVSTVTSLEFSLDSVYFNTMSRDMQVLDWNHIGLQPVKYHIQSPAHILEEAIRVYKHLPKSSIVLIESRLTRKRNIMYLYYLLSISRLQMALQTLINEGLSTGGQHKVFHINDSFVINTFDLRVGGERVGSQNTVQQIQNNEYSPAVSVAPEFWHRYNELMEEDVKERYANCLLLSVAFCKQIFTNKSLSTTDESQ